MKYYNGLVPEPIKLRDYDYEICCGTSTNMEIPNTYVIPEENIPDVYDQGETFSCTGHATASCAESHIQKVSGERIRLSKFFSYGRKECRGTYTGQGMYTSQLFKGLLQIGFIKEYLFDYFADVPDIIKFANSRDDLLKFGKEILPNGYVSMNYANEEKRWETVKKALYNDKEAIYITSSSRVLFGGGHAIIIIGYTEELNGKNGRWVLIQNSWGKSYGDNGRKWIPISVVDDIRKFIWDEIALPFKDVKKSDWFYDEVRATYLSGFIKGTSESDFSPYDSVIRGDIAVIIGRLLDKVEYSGNAFIETKRQQGETVNNFKFKEAVNNLNFVDVSQNDYYFDGVAKATANGIMQGVTGISFNPKFEITRAEMATVLVRTYEVVCKALTKAIGISFNGIDLADIAFKDVPDTEWYFDEIRKAVSLDLMQGDTRYIFRPEDNLSRAEAAAVMHRLFKKIEDFMIQM